MHKVASMDVYEVVDGQKIGRAAIIFTLVATLVLVSDGFDLAAMGYIAPALIEDWGITPAQLVPALSASIIGMMIGGPLAGMLGDRFGRKRLMLGGLALTSLSTLAMMLVGSVGAIEMLRFVTGLGLGAIVPNAVALVAELTPQRHRGRALTLVASGVIVGTSLPGFTVAALAPHFGWRSILLVGGILPLVAAFLAALFIPESIKYLVARGGREGEVRHIARKLRPDLTIGDDARFFVPAAAQESGGLVPVKYLLRGDFRVVTPMLWIIQITVQMAGFFALTWLPTLLQAAGATVAQAGISTSFYSVGGFCSMLLLLFVMNRFGVFALVLLLLAGAPFVAVMALPGLPTIVHGAIIAGAGFCVHGAQLAITVLLGLFYPTGLRSSGVGWTQAIGRIGSLAAPLVGALLLEMAVTMRFFPLAPALLLLVGALASAMLAILCMRKFGGLRSGEFSALTESAAHGNPD